MKAGGCCNCKSSVSKNWEVDNVPFSSSAEENYLQPISFKSFLKPVRRVESWLAQRKERRARKAKENERKTTIARDLRSLQCDLILALRLQMPCNSQQKNGNALTILTRGSSTGICLTACKPPKKLKQVFNSYI